MYPTKMEANGHIYNINTDYRIALACLRAIDDDEITNLERYLAIEGLLLGYNVDNDDRGILQDKIATYNNYIYVQVEALKKLFEINDSVSQLLITNTLINIYYFYMKAVFYKCNMADTDVIISSLKKEKWIQLWLNEGTNWMDIINNIKAGQVYDDEYVVFYEETFNLWAARLLKE